MYPLLKQFEEFCPFHFLNMAGTVQFSSVAQSCPTLCDPMNRSTLGLPVHHQLLEFTQTHVHRVRDAIQPSHPLSSPSPPVPNPSQQQSLLAGIPPSNSALAAHCTLECSPLFFRFLFKTPSQGLFWFPIYNKIHLSCHFIFPSLPYFFSSAWVTL